MGSVTIATVPGSYVPKVLFKTIHATIAASKFTSVFPVPVGAFTTIALNKLSFQHFTICGYIIFLRSY